MIFVFHLLVSIVVLPLELSFDVHYLLVHGHILREKLSSVLNLVLVDLLQKPAHDIVCDTLNVAARVVSVEDQN